MGRIDNSQFNIRSAFAKKRAHELAKQSGMTVAQIVEDALRGYVPPGGAKPTGSLVRKGPLLVLAGGRRVTQQEVDAAIEADRTRDPFDDG